MKTSFVFPLVLAGCAVFAGPVFAEQNGPPAAPAGNKWVVTFEDDFTGRSIDEKKWLIEGDYKRKDGWWTKSACKLDGNGNLEILTAREGEKLISGCVSSAGKFEQKYGYWECKAKMPKHPGHWAAFWLMCNGVGTVGNEGRDGTEIDIMEFPKRDGTINFALHWDGYGKDHKVKGSEVKMPEVLNDWATYSLYWSPTEYIFYVNRKEVWRSNAGGVCQVPTHILVSTEIASWGGKIDEKKLPDKFIIDYVRVWDLKNGWAK
ncbi:MAG: glycoside hydrolase family 16 protein [Verrucomicrobiota bacterium]